MNQKGIALIVVLWISAILTLLLYAFLIEMRAEAALSDSYGARKKAEQLALSAIDKAIVTIESDRRTARSGPIRWPASASNRWRNCRAFWVGLA